MEIELNEILVKDVVNGYTDSQEEGVYGYNGKLNIRPKYQREFVYKDAQRDAVINTIRNNFPLNVMYWVKLDNGSFEVMDGQQRTISIAQYVNGVFSINGQYFHNLTEEEKNQVLDYKLMIYICEGSDREKLDWFNIVNIAGEKLTDQELRNAIYSGEWVTDAKRYFSKNGCPAYAVGKDYLTGSPIRQEFLETAIKWISKDNIVDYMAQHQHETDAAELWRFFQNVITWVKSVFPKYRKEMKGVDWGHWYHLYSDIKLSQKDVEEQIKTLMIDDDVTKKSGIYPYILTGEEKYLSIRSFTEQMRRKAYENQDGICIKCQKQFDFSEMDADHITPWSEGGKTIAENCQMLCKSCNRRKSNK